MLDDWKTKPRFENKIMRVFVEEKKQTLLPEVIFTTIKAGDGYICPFSNMLGVYSSTSHYHGYVESETRDTHVFCFENKSSVKIYTPPEFCRAILICMSVTQVSKIFSPENIFGYKLTEVVTSGKFYVCATGFPSNFLEHNKKIMKLYYTHKGKYYKCKLVNQECHLRDREITKEDFNSRVGK